ncbi:MAG: hypothetical protein EOO91_13000 [Pedobacter sp.]|nr:MAG: hypothetical protein EOO91_13000 [Pedobacter sp.]
MKSLLTFIPMLVCAQAFAQDPTKIEVNNASKTGIVLPKTIKKNLKNDENYIIVLTGVNSANISFKVQTKSLSLYTAIPDPLKTVLPGITGSSDLRPLGGGPPATLINDLNGIAAKLKNIKTEAEELYAQTKLAPDNAKAKIALQNVATSYNQTISNFDEKEFTALGALISNDIQYLNSYKEIFDAMIKNQQTAEQRNIEFHAKLTSIAKELQQNDYVKLYEYITKSVGAVAEVSSKPFIPTKDLMELKFTIVDIFKKDTLVNETRTLFSNGGGIGLSFSTGFFYTEMLSDQPYYLTKQPDGTMAINKDKRTISDVSIGAMGHLYYKVSSSFRVGPSIGIAVSPFDGKTRYLLGGSMLLGREKMIGINIGRAWAKIKEFSSSVEGTSSNPFLPAGATAVPTVDKIKNVWFLGLTYNLVSTRK